MLLGLLFPTEGSIKILGRSATDVEKNEKIGYLPEESYLYRFLNAEETLDFYGRLFRMPKKARRAKTGRTSQAGEDRARPQAAAQGIFQGHDPPDRARPGPHQRPGDRLPGRADQRPGPERPGRREGPHPRPEAAGKDRGDVLPPAGGDRGRVRPDRHPQRRGAEAAGHGGRAAPHPRGDADRHPRTEPRGPRRGRGRAGQAPRRGHGHEAEEDAGRPVPADRLRGRGPPRAGPSAPRTCPAKAPPTTPPRPDAAARPLSSFPVPPRVRRWTSPPAPSTPAPPCGTGSRSSGFSPRSCWPCRSCSRCSPAGRAGRPATAGTSSPG